MNLILITFGVVLVFIVVPAVIHHGYFRDDVCNMTVPSLMEQLPEYGNPHTVSATQGVYQNVVIGCDYCSRAAVYFTMINGVSKHTCSTCQPPKELIQ